MTEEYKIAEELKALAKQVSELKDLPWLFLESLLAEPKKAVHFRAILKAIYGTPISVPFSGTATAGTTTVFVSKKIPYRFSVVEVLGIPNGLKLYFYVSEDSDTTATGYNLLANYSNKPYLAGGNLLVRAFTDPEEFDKNNYLKVAGLNETAENIELNAVITIKIYPTK